MKKYILSDKDRDKLLDVIENPPNPNDELLELFDKHEKDNPPKKTNIKQLRDKLKKGV